MGLIKNWNSNTTWREVANKPVTLSSYRKTGRQHEHSKSTQRVDRARTTTWFTCDLEDAMVRMKWSAYCIPVAILPIQGYTFETVCPVSVDGDCNLFLLCVVYSFLCSLVYGIICSLLKISMWGFFNPMFLYIYACFDFEVTSLPNCEGIDHWPWLRWKNYSSRKYKKKLWRRWSAQWQNNANYWHEFG